MSQTFTIYPTPIATPQCRVTGIDGSNMLLDASNDGAGAMFLAPKAGSITDLFLNIGAKTGTAPTYRFGLEGQTATRSPDGSILGGGTAKVDLADPAIASAWRTLDTPLTVTQGQALAAVIRYNTGTVGGSNNITVRVVATTVGSPVQPYGVLLTAGTWSQSSAFPLMAARYSDGSVVHMMFAVASVTNNNVGSGSSPLQRGNKWTPQFSVRLTGVYLGIRPQNSSDFKVNVYQGATTTPILTQTIDPDVNWGSNASDNPGSSVPLTPTTLNAGTAYRFTVEPTTANTFSEFYSWTYIDESSKQATYGELIGTTSPSSIAWTDTLATVFPVVPVIDQITTPGNTTIFSYPPPGVPNYPRY